MPKRKNEEEEALEDDDEKVESAVYDKKQKPNVPDLQNVLPSSFHCKTTNMKKLRTMLRCYGSDKDMMDVCMHFDALGMSLYSRTSIAPIVVKAFWNKSFFQDYKCAVPFRVWVSPSSFLHIIKKMKDVEAITIETLNTKEMSGLRLSGTKKSSCGDNCNFHINLPESTGSHDMLLMDQDYVWSIITPSTTFNENVSFTQEATFITVRYNQHSLSFESVFDSGLLGTTIYQSAEPQKNIEAHAFENMFQKNLLKFVAQAHSMSKMLTIGYHVPNPGKISIVQFTYSLDSEDPGSHFTIYVGDAGLNSD